jgi:hypothetical protein
VVTLQAYLNGTLNNGILELPIQDQHVPHVRCDVSQDALAVTLKSGLGLRNIQAVELFASGHIRNNLQTSDGGKAVETLSMVGVG